MIAGGVFGALAGWLAVDRNRSALPWWGLGVLIGPLAVAVLLARPKRTGERPASL